MFSGPEAEKLKTGENPLMTGNFSPDNKIIILYLFVSFKYIPIRRQKDATVGGTVQDPRDGYRIEILCGSSLFSYINTFSRKAFGELWKHNKPGR